MIFIYHNVPHYDLCIQQKELNFGEALLEHLNPLIFNFCRTWFSSRPENGFIKTASGSTSMRAYKVSARRIHSASASVAAT
jgi:hypothetical protein